MADTRLTSGELRHWMNIEAPIGVLHESEPVSIATAVPMSVDEETPVLEQQALGGLRTETHYKLRSRYRTDVKASYVLLEQCCTQRRFEVLAVVPGERRDEMRFRCVTNG